jgi:hypothetical protein
MSTAVDAVHPALVPDRDDGYRLVGVYETVADGCRVELILAFDGGTLTFRADPDYDTIETRFDATDLHPSEAQLPLSGTAFDRFVGAELGWSWSAVNQQGYRDTVLLSFDGVIPNVAAHVIASSVEVYGIGPAIG